MSGPESFTITDVRRRREIRLARAEQRSGTMSTEASTLGWKPGDWPAAAWLTGYGPGARYERTSACRRDGEIVYVRYVSADGRSILIHND